LIGRISRPSTARFGGWRRSACCSGTFARRSCYEVTPKRHHDHLIDVESGRVTEFRCPQIERLQARIARRHGYRIISHRLDIFVVPVRSARELNGQ
jgi:Fe2+ or Zn2+ uptake regulation protein